MQPWLWLAGLVAVMSAVNAQAGTTPQSITFAQPADKTFSAAAFTVTATASSGLAIVLTSLTSTVCTVAAKTVTPIATGTCTLRASQVGNATFASAANVDRSVKIAKASQTITFAALSARAFGTAPFLVSAAITSKLAVVFTSSTVAICSVTGNSVTMLAAGTCTLRAAQPGNANFNAATVVAQSFAVAKSAQAITFTAIAAHNYGDAPFALAATTSSGLAVTFSSTTTAVCKISGSTLTIVTIGNCAVRASQSGNANYTAATDVTRSFSVAKSAQTITFAAIANHAFADPSFALAASSSSGLAVIFASVTPGACTVSTSTVTIVGTGTCTVRASQAGNANYAAALTVDRNFSIGLGMQSITFSPIASRTYGDSAFAAIASSSSGLPITLTTLTPAVCALDGLTVAIVAAGACTLRASQPGDAHFIAASPVDRGFAVAKANQTITFALLAPRPLSDPPFTVAATASSKLPVQFSSATTSVCTVSGSTVTLIRAGGCRIDANQSGNANINFAPTSAQTFAVGAVTQSISFDTIGDQSLAASPVTAHTNASSGLPVTLASTTPATCSIATSQITLIAAGSCSIRATQSGNGIYPAATPVDRTFNIVAIAQRITFPTMADRQLSAVIAVAAASASSGLPVHYATVTPSVCTTDGSASIALAATGVCGVRASQAGNNRVASATDVDRSFNVLSTAQTILFESIGAQTLATSPLALSATSPSKLQIVFSAQPAAVCTAIGSMLSLLAPGICSVSASESVDGVHSHGSLVTRSFAVLRTPSFMPAKVITVGPWPDLVLAGRFHGGPDVDLLVPWQNDIAIYAGDGKGTFVAAGHTEVGVFPEFAATADFNNDGKLDFAISYIGSKKVGSYFGGGNDSFTRPDVWPDAPTPAGLVATDLDGDGNSDLVVANADSGGDSGQSLTLLSGRGDGSFQPRIEIPICNGPVHLVVADFNNDALPDLAVACERDNAIAVALHHADGTFDLLPQINGVTAAIRVAAADLDRDGNIDLVATSRYGNVTVLLGSGDGRFRNVGELASVAGGDVVIADFNADGAADIAVADPLHDNVSIFAGVGDGTFAAPVRMGSGAYPMGLATADVDNNGSVDLMYANQQDGTVSVLRNSASMSVAAHVVAESPASQATPIGTAFATPLAVRVTDAANVPITGMEVRFELPPGSASATFSNGASAIDTATDRMGIATTPRLRAGRAGATYIATVRAGTLAANFSLTNQIAGTPPAFASSPPPGGAIGMPYSFTLIASGSPTPRFSLAPGTLPPGLLLSPTGLLNGTPTAAGMYSGVFSASNGNAPDATQSFSISIGVPTQSITFNAIADQSIDAGAVSAIAAASSGLPVSFESLTPQICVVGGSTVQLLTAGRCTIRATQPGNAQFSAAVPIVHSFNVRQGAQTLRWTTPDDARLGAPPVFVDSVASSGLPVTLSSRTPSVCVIVDNVHVNFIARGMCMLQALQKGNDAYSAAQATASMIVRGATQTISFPLPHNGRIDEPTYLLAAASSGLPVTLESATPGICRVIRGNMIAIGDDREPASNLCTVVATQTGNDVFDPAVPASVTFGFGFIQTMHQDPSPAPHIVYATYLGGLGSDLTFDIVVGPEGSAFVGGTVGTSNFPKLSSQQFTNAGLDLVFVSKVQSQTGAIDYSVAVGGAASNISGSGAIPEIAAQQAMTIAPSGELVVAAYASGADFPQQQGNYIRKGPLGIFKIDGGGHVRALSISLDPAIQTIRAITCDKAGAVYLTGVANMGLATSPGAAIESSKVSGSAPYLIKLSPTGTPVFATYLTVPNTRPAGPPDKGQGKHDVETSSYALTIDDAGNSYIAGQSSAADFPVTAGALDTVDHNNRDAFVAKVNATGTALPFVARIGFRDVERATGIALEPDGSIVIAGKTASTDDFDGGYAFQTSVRFNQNGMQSMRVDREFGFVAQIDPAASRVIFMAAVGSFGGDLVDLAFEPAPRPLKIAVDSAGFIYAAGTGSQDRTLPLMGLMTGMPNEGVFLMKISPNGGQRYSTFLGEGVATGVATDGFGNAYVTGYAKGAMPTVSASQATCTLNAQDLCITPFIIKVNDAAFPVLLTSPAPSVEQGASVTLMATFGDLRATGTIDLLENGSLIANAPIAAGKTVFTLTPLLGFHHYVATFHGGGYANGASSREWLQVVTQKAAP